MTVFRLFAVALAVILVSSTSHAAYKLQAGTGGTPNGDNARFDGTSGVTVELFLVEDTGTAFTTFNADFSVDRTSGTATESNPDNGSNPPFIGTTFGSSAPFTFTNFSTGAASTSGFLGATPIEFVKIGQFDVTNPLNTGDAVYSFLDNAPLGAGFSLSPGGSSQGQDDQIYANSTTFTVVPEPSSGLALLGLASILAYRRRRA